MKSNVVEMLPNFQELLVAANEGREMFKLLLNQSYNAMDLESEAYIREALRNDNEYQRHRALCSLVTGFVLHNRYHRLYPDVVKIMGVQHLETKRLCFLFITLASRASPPTTPSLSKSPETLASPNSKGTYMGTTLLTVNGFQKDAFHRNHIVRAWAIKSMSQLLIPEVTPFLIEAIRRGVADGSPFVRLVTANACVKLAVNNPTWVGFALQCVLIRLLNDFEEVVVASALHNFYYVLLTFPDLLTLNPEEWKHCESVYNLNEYNGADEDTWNCPLLACLHPMFYKLVSHSIDRLPNHGKVAGIYLLTYYCRTFLASPDDSTVETSAHYQLFLSKLLSLKYTNSATVMIALCESLLLLSSKTQLAVVLEEILPFAVHRFRVARPQHGLELLRIMTWTVHSRCKNCVESILPLLAIHGTDRRDMVIAKLNALQSLASFPDFPIDIVCTQLLQACYWQDETLPEHCTKELLNALTRILHVRLKCELAFPVKNVVKHLLACITTAGTPYLHEHILRTLSEVTRLSREFHRNSMHSVLLLVAQTVMAFLSKEPNDAVAGGLSAAVELFILHHALAPDIALDVFRVIVKTMLSKDCTFLLYNELQLTILYFGMTLYAFCGQQDEHPDATKKLHRIMLRFLKHLESSTVVDRTVQDIALCCDACCVSDPATLYMTFGTDMKTLTHQGDPGNDKLTSPWEDESDNVLRFATCNLPNLSAFVGSDAAPYRKVVRDTQRVHASLSPVTLLKTPRTTSSFPSSTHKSSESVADEDNVDAFYKSTEWDSSSLMLPLKTNVDPLTSLFGRQGAVVFGEEPENDSDGTSELSHSIAPEEHMASNAENSRTDQYDDSDLQDWDRIKKMEFTLN